MKLDELRVESGECAGEGSRPKQRAVQNSHPVIKETGSNFGRWRDQEVVWAWLLDVDGVHLIEAITGSHYNTQIVASDRVQFKQHRAEFSPRDALLLRANAKATFLSPMAFEMQYWTKARDAHRAKLLKDTKERLSVYCSPIVREGDAL